MFTVGMTLPAVFGTDIPKGNYADLTTKGWEGVLSWRDKFQAGGKPFDYEVRLTMADYTSTIDKFNNPNKKLSDYYAGQTIGEIWGYTTDGYFTSLGDVENSAKQTLFKASNTGQWLPGDIKFRDLNGDGQIDNGDNTVTSPGDRSIIGNSTPRYTYGIILSANWNNFFFRPSFKALGNRIGGRAQKLLFFGDNTTVHTISCPNGTWGIFGRPKTPRPTCRATEGT